MIKDFSPSIDTHMHIQTHMTLFLKTVIAHTIFLTGQMNQLANVTWRYNTGQPVEIIVYYTSY